MAAIVNGMVEEQIGQLDSVFHALANPTRREIVGLLKLKPHIVTELAPKFSMSLAAVSKHVAVLERAGLIDREIIGRRHVCRLKPEALTEAYQWLGAYEQFWQRRLDALERVLLQEKRSTRWRPRRKTTAT